jgi:hypothetical protein
MPKLRDAQYQEKVPGLAVDLPELHPCTAEFFVDWLIKYKGLPAETRDNVILNLKRDYERVELRGSMKQAMAHPPITLPSITIPQTIHNHFSLFGKKL